VLFGVNQRLRVEDVDSPLVQIRPVKTVLLAVITGDRGLCGGYNNQVIKKVHWLSGPLMLVVPPSQGLLAYFSGLFDKDSTVQQYNNNSSQAFQLINLVLTRCA